ncbi:MAG TPA: hypothetical protein VKU60_10300 [Chloroflexota bacterium]|nr:hypothetical protein [Chloroflexota bacterium]
MAHFREKAMRWCERLLNPAVNSLHVLVFAVMVLLVARSSGMPPLFAGLATCAFALTPQFYHALSARNFGLSSRGTGLLLLTVFFLAAWAAGVGLKPALSWPSLVVSAWLLWGFSTFAQQATCILSVIILAISGQYVALLGALLGLALFIALHPRYSLGYLRYTLSFMRAYRRELAPIYILAARKSIWRDLVWDLWLKRPGGHTEVARYAYGNSALIVLLLNPLAVLACWAVLAGRLPSHGFVAYAGTVTLAGMLTMLLTSFRATRFLGEPERYVEAVAPWGVLCATYVLATDQQWTLLAVVCALFLLMDLAQLYASKLLLAHVDNTQTEQLARVEEAVRERFPTGVRFCSNNEQFTKLLMQNDWQYAYCLAVGQDYCGMKVQEAFGAFPRLRREACERIVSTYRVNACLLDRAVFESLFAQPPPGLQRMSVAYESPRLRLLILDWAESSR